MKIEEADKLLLYKVIAGSKAYGLDTPESDIDTRGIFMLPNSDLIGILPYSEEAMDDKHDNSYYELNKFAKLLVNNNPNILELLFANDTDILHTTDKILPLIENRDKFLTRNVKHSFAGYATSQINKARGTNKKINNPIEVKKKSVIDFCYIIDKNTGYSKDASKWLRDNNIKQEDIGLSELPNGVQQYKVYVSDGNIIFKGIAKENSYQMRHSEIPKDYPLTAFLHFNLNGFSSYTKDYKEYMEWEAKKNPVRYADNIKNGQNYDGKNMMHCLRLLDMSIEILEGKGVILKRPNRDFLLSVKKGLMTYDIIMNLVDDKLKQLEYAYKNTSLPDKIDSKLINDIVLEMRKNN